MSVAAARCEGAELPREMYSVLRSQETSAAIGGVPPPWRPWRPKPSALPAGSSRSAWSFGSSSGGFCGSGFSAVKSKKKHGRRVRECVGEEGSLEQVGRTMVVRAVFPEGLPFPEIEGHAALGVDYHGEQCLIRGGVEKLGARVAFWVGWDIEEFWWTWWGW